MKFNLKKAGILILIILFSFLFFSSIDLDKLNRIFDLYNQDLNRAISQSKIQSSYEAFISNIEIRLNILNCEWEKDKLLLLSQQIGSENEEQDKKIIENAYNNWSKNVEQKVNESKTEYLSKDIDLSILKEKENAKKEELLAQFNKIYTEIKNTINSTESIKLDRTELITKYQGMGYAEFEKALNESLGNITNFFDEKQKEKEQIARINNIDLALLSNSFEKEKERIIVERKKMLTAIYNTYLYRISQMILADQDSLRISEEKQRAREIAKDIQKRVNEELNESIDEKLDRLLSKDILSEEDLSGLSQQLQTVYKEGLEIWAKAAVELAENEHKWYENYNEIYNNGIQAWTDAINELVALKNNWIKQFSAKVNDALKDWDSTALANENAKNDFLTSIYNFQKEESEKFDEYTQNIIKVLNSGKSTVSSIDSYIQSYMSMIGENLGVFMPANKDISEIYSNLNTFLNYINQTSNEGDWIIPDNKLSDSTIVENYINTKLKNNEKLTNSNYNKLNTKIDIYSGTVTVEYYIEYDVTIKYKEPEGGWTYGYEKRKTNYVYVMNQKADAKTFYSFYEPDKPIYQIINGKVGKNYTIQDYKINILSTLYEDNGFTINYGIDVSLWNNTTKKNEKKTIQYSIKYKNNNGIWNKTIQNEKLIDSELKTGINIGDAINNLKNNNNLFGNESYFSRINELYTQKVNIVNSISTAQLNMVDMLSESIKDGLLLENYKTNGEKAFDSILNLVENNIYLSELDVEVLSAYHKMNFWQQQKEIVESVLDFALNEADRENANITKTKYENTKQLYETKLAEYKNLVQSLNNKSEEYDAKMKQLNELESELAELERQYQENVQLLQTFKYSNEEIKKYISSFVSSISEMTAQYTEYLKNLLRNNPSEIAQIEQYMQDLSAKIFNTKNELINSNYLDNNNANSLKYLLTAKENIYSNLVELFKNNSSNNTNSSFENEIIYLDKISNFKKWLNNLAIDAKARKNQQLYSLILQTNNVLIELENKASKSELLDESGQKIKALERIYSYKLLLPSIYNIFSYIDNTISGYKNALAKYYNKFYNPENNNNQNQSQDQIEQNIKDILENSKTELDVYTLLDMKSYFDIKMEIAINEKESVNNFINDIGQNNIKYIEVSQEQIDDIISIVNALDNYLKENDKEKKNELENQIKRSILDFTGNLYSNIKERKILTDSEKESLKNFILNFLGIKNNSSEILDLDNFHNINVDSILIDNFEKTKNSIFSLCSLGIYNELADMIKFEIDQNGENKKIIDEYARKQYLKNLFSFFKKLNVINEIENVEKDEENYEKSFNWIIENLKNFYFNIFDWHLVKKTKEYEQSLRNSFNDLFINIDSTNINSKLNIITSSLKQNLIQKNSITYATIFLQNSFIFRQFENISISGNLNNYDTIKENIGQFSNNVYNNEITFLDKINHVNLLNQNNNGNNNNNLFNYIKTNLNNDKEVKSYLAKLRTNNNQGDLEQYYLLSELLNYFFTLSSQEKTIYTENCIKKSIENNMLSNLLNQEFDKTNVYTQGIYSEAQTKINNLKRIKNENNEIIFDLIKNRILISSVEYGLNKGIGTDTNLISSSNLALLLKEIYKDEQTWKSNPILIGYYNEITNYFIQNVVSEIYLRNKQQIIINGNIDYNQLYNLIEMKLKQIFGQDYNKIKTSFFEDTFNGKSSEQVQKIVNSYSNVMYSISDYYGTNGFEYERWYNEKIKNSLDGSIIFSTFENGMKQEIENSISWDKKVNDFYSVSTIGRLTDILNSFYYDTLDNNKKIEIITALISTYLSKEFNYKTLVNELCQDNNSQKLEAIKNEINKVFADQDLNQVLQVKFSDNLNSVKENIINRLMYDVKIQVELNDLVDARKRFEDFITKLKKNNQNNIFSSKNSFDNFIKAIMTYNDEEISEEIEKGENKLLITQYDIDNLIKDKIMQLRLTYASKLLSPFDSDEDIGYISEISGIENEFLTFLFKNGLIKEENSSYVQNLKMSYLFSPQSTQKIQEFVERIQEKYEVISKNQQKINYIKLIEQCFKQCMNEVGSQQAIYSYLKYMEDQGITSENVFQMLREEKISQEEAKLIFSNIIIKIDNTNIDNILNKLWIEGVVNYSCTKKQNDGSTIQIEFGESPRIFISEDQGLMSFIQSQNKIANLLISLADVLKVSNIINSDLNETNIADENNGKDFDFSSLVKNILNATQSSDLNNLITFTISENNISNYFDSFTVVSSQKLQSNGLLNMLQKMIEAKNKLKETGQTEQNIQSKIDNLNIQINGKKESITKAKKDLLALKNQYNDNVTNVNNAVKEVDKAYLNYLKAKEIYFFCVNIYADGKDVTSAIDMYKKQLAKYTKQYEEEKAKYEVALEIFKMNEQEKKNKWKISAQIDEKTSNILDMKKIYYLLTSISGNIEIEKENYSKRNESIKQNIKDILVEVIYNGTLTYENLNETQRDAIDKFYDEMLKYFDLTPNATSVDFEQKINNALNLLFTKQYIYVKVTVDYTSTNDSNNSSGSEDEVNVADHQNNGNSSQNNEQININENENIVITQKSKSKGIIDDDGNTIYNPSSGTSSGGTSTGVTNTGTGSSSNNNSGTEDTTYEHEPVIHKPESVTKIISLQEYIEKYYSIDKKESEIIIDILKNKNIKNRIIEDGITYTANTKIEFIETTELQNILQLKLEGNACKAFKYNTSSNLDSFGIALKDLINALTENKIQNFADTKGIKDIVKYIGNVFKGNNSGTISLDSKGIKYNDKGLNAIVNYVYNSTDFMPYSYLFSLSTQIKVNAKKITELNNILNANNWKEYAEQQNTSGKAAIANYLNGIFQNNIKKDEIINLIGKVIRGNAQTFSGSLTLKDCLKSFSIKIQDEMTARNILIETAKQKFIDNKKEYQQKLGNYSNYKGLLASYNLEKQNTEKEIEIIYITRLNDKDKEILNTIYEQNEKNWEKVNISKYEGNIKRIIYLSQRYKELNNLVDMYSRYLGIPVDTDNEQNSNMQNNEENSIKGQKEDTLAILGLKDLQNSNPLHIEDKNIITKEAIVSLGKELYRNDYSENTLLLMNFNESKEIYKFLNNCGDIVASEASSVLNGIMESGKNIRKRMEQESAKLVELTSNLKINISSEEKARFNDKADIGLNGGISEFDNSLSALHANMMSWLSDMKQKLIEAKDMWHKKEVEYTMQRESWINSVKEKKSEQTEVELGNIKKKVSELSGGIQLDMSQYTGVEKVAKGYIKDVSMPDWLSNYEIIANNIFEVLHKKENPQNSAIDDQINILQTRISAFEQNKEKYELEKLINELNMASKKIVEQTEGFLRRYKGNIEGILYNSGFIKKGSSFVKKILSSFSLLGGEKHEEKVIEGFKGTEFEKELKGKIEVRENIKSISEPEQQKIRVYTEIERINKVKEEIFGSEKTAGKIYTEYLGRMPLDNEINEYISGEKKKETILSGLTNWLIKLFNGKEDKKQEKEQEDILIKSISSKQNKELETGRIMLEFSKINSIEQQAIAQRDGGLFNVPLLPGTNITLASIGSLAVSLIPAAGLAGSLLFQAGSGLVNIATASEQFKDKVALDMFKGMATSLMGEVTGGITGSIKSGLNLGNNFGGILTNAAIDAGSNLVSSTINSAINALSVNGFNKEAFAGGLAAGILSSGSTFASSTISNGINVALGAQWQKQYGGYEFGVAYDQQSKYTLLDYYNEAMKKSGGFLGGLTKQAIDNITGVSDGWTFNILNTKDLGLKGVNASGLLAITVGGSKGFSWDISSSGLDISYSGIKDMLFGMKRAAKYTSFTSTKEKTAVYIAENMLLYSGVKDTEQVIENIENYLYGQGDIKIDFSTDENKRIDNTIYISKKLISSSQHYDGNVAIINGFSQYGILAASLAHESKHDGKNKIDPKQAEKAQQDLNIYLSAGMTYEQAIEQIKKDYGQEVGEEIDEDIEAHTYETGIWGGLKEVFGVSDIELDQKLSIYKDLGKDIFKGYLTWKYELGHEKEKTKDKYNASGLLALMNNYYMGEKEKNKNLEAWISILKGFVKIENGNELYEMLDKAGIINNIYSGYLAMFKKGYNVEKVKNEIEGLSINILSSKNVLEEVINGDDKYKEIEKYINLSEIPSINLTNIIASFVKDTGKNGKENEKDKNNAALLMWDIIKKGGDSAKTQVINIINCGIKEFEGIDKMHELKNKINNDYKDINEKIRKQMNNLLQNWTENVLKKLRENNNTYSVEKTYSKDSPYGKQLQDAKIVRFKVPICNIGTSNYLNLMGYDGCSVILPDFFDNKEGIYYAKSKERLEDKTYVANATKLIENIESKVDDFTSFEQILNFAQLKSLSVEQFKNTINTIFQLFSAAGYAVIATMINNNPGEASHIYPIYNGLALDINFQYKINGVFQWGQRVPLWVPIGGIGTCDDLFKVIQKSSTFNYDKEQWLKEKIEELKKTKKKDGTYYTEKEARGIASKSSVYNYSFNFYILNYPVYMFSNAWGFTSFYY